jgi:hypothetical protein
MKIKLALAAISACAGLTLMTSANATICPFVDHFFIDSPVPVRVMNASTEGNLSYTQMGENYFRLGCQDYRSTSSGVLRIEIGMDHTTKCTLNLQDGPFEMNPSVTEVFCGGTAGKLFYVGMDHPFGTHDYTLKFTV